MSLVVFTSAVGAASGMRVRRQRARTSRPRQRRPSAHSSCCSARTAPTRRVTESRSGKMPTTSVRRRISLLRRSLGLFPLRQAGRESVRDSRRRRVVSISAGFTVEEIREFVHEYTARPYGDKGAWLAARGVSYDRLRRWRLAVFDGDLDRGLVPRDSSPVKIPPGQRAALERHHATERVEHEAEVARLNARIRELEEANGALGKAIGLLHSMSEQ